MCDGETLAPVAGVSIETYARILRGTSAYNYDRSMLAVLAAGHGIDAESWRRAHEVWNHRLRTDPAAAHRFSDAYGDL